MRSRGGTLKWIFSSHFFIRALAPLGSRLRAGSSCLASAQREPPPPHPSCSPNAVCFWKVQAASASTLSAPREVQAAPRPCRPGHARRRPPRWGPSRRCPVPSRAQNGGRTAAFRGHACGGCAAEGRRWPPPWLPGSDRGPGWRVCPRASPGSRVSAPAARRPPARPVGDLRPPRDRMGQPATSRGFVSDPSRMRGSGRWAEASSEARDGLSRIALLLRARPEVSLFSVGGFCFSPAGTLRLSSEVT